MAALRTLLVANRGEIAVRILSTARACGLRTVAVYSDADAGAPHVRLADDAVRIGPPPPTESYLAIDRTIEAARAAGADAVHPGYGFLAENADFARACDKAGLVFVGPGADAIALMGNKAAAKQRMRNAGVPCVPGYDGEDQSDAALAAAAREIGFPVMVKAAAGGGGRGMRLVASENELAPALEQARAEAKNAFGNDQLILEKAIVRPRHVEIQILADAHGHVVHLGERDCSVQRRHQKIIEESPCPVLTPELRQAMGRAAVEAARAIGYRNAGTVEFLLDEDGRFYFLEMNTRLQVEHPVTELTTGLDLVALQLDVAQDRPLELEQDDIALRGHAIEARLYAEDPAHDFLPSTGRIALWSPPHGEGIRVDAGVETGTAISPFYDPMIAKVIAWGPTRDVARRRLIAALEQTALFGVRSNRDFLVEALAHETFAAGRATTAFLEEAAPLKSTRVAEPGLAEYACAAVLEYTHERSAAEAAAISAPAALRNWTSSGLLVSRFCYAHGDESVEVVVTALDGDRYRVGVGDENVEAVLADLDGPRARIALDGRRHAVAFCMPQPGVIELSIAGRSYALRNIHVARRSAGDTAGGGRILAPMHGLLREVFVKPGDRVARGHRLAVLEAMKMQHEIIAAVDGTVSAVLVEPGTQVAADALLLEIEATDGAPAGGGS